MKTRQLRFGFLGNGITVYDRANEVNGDYETVAHISYDRSVKYYTEDLTEANKKDILEVAEKSKGRAETITTQILKPLETEKARDMEIVKGVFRFMYNIPSDFIEKNWNVGFIRDHFQNKYTSLCKEAGGYASVKVVHTFFSALDRENAQTFANGVLEYIRNNPDFEI